METTGSISSVPDTSGTESTQDVLGPADEVIFTHTTVSQDYVTVGTTHVQTQDSRGNITLEDSTHHVLGELVTQQISTASPSYSVVVQRCLPVAPPRDVCEALDPSEPCQSHSFETVTSELRTSEFPIPRPCSPIHRGDTSCPASPFRSADTVAFETVQLVSAALRYPQSLAEQRTGNPISPNDVHNALELHQPSSEDIAPSVQEAPPIPEVNVAESESSKLEVNAAPISEVNAIPSPDRDYTETESYGQSNDDKNEVLGQNTVPLEETFTSFAEYPYRSPNLPPSSPPSAQISPMKLSPGLPDHISAFMSKRAEKFARDVMANETITHEKLFLSPPPLVSSPLPSSPPTLFSSPARMRHHFSPPSSPPPADCMVKDRCTVSRFFPSYDSPITNRNPAAQASLDELHTFAPDEDSEDTTVSSHQHTSTPEPPFNSDQPDEMVRVELSPPKPPNPMRSTLASQRRQHKKLTTPFKTPLLPDARKMSKHDSYSTMKRLHPADVDTECESTQKTSISPLGRERSTPSSPLRYSQGAARQFRSPFVQRPLTLVPKYRAVSILNAPKATSSSAAPTIQALQTKVQKLRQAIKIKRENVGEDGTKLEALTKKWKTVGREVAWQVWETVKDTEVGAVNRVGGGHRWGDDESPIVGRKRRFDDSWGYGNEAKRARMESYDGGWDQEDSSLDAVQDDPESDEGGNAGHHTLGTMLRYMGIAPETLGWDETEGDFVDRD